MGVKWVCVGMAVPLAAALLWIGYVARNEAAVNRCIALAFEVRPDSEGEPVARAQWRWWPPGYECEYRYPDGVIVTR